MRVLVDITHPAYAHFFRAVLPALRERGYIVRVTSREKDVTLELLNVWGIEHHCLSTAGRSATGLLVEMIVRVWRLCREIKRFRPDVLLARDGVYACQAGWLSGVKAISFDDTDDAPIQHACYFPFAWRVYTDHAYRRRLGGKQRFYTGVSCIPYLQSPLVADDDRLLERFGFRPNDKVFLVRLVSWTSNHDYGQRGFDQHHLRRLVDRLKLQGRVVVSSEVELEDSLEELRSPVAPQDMHSLLAKCSLYVGESATMAAEAAMLGVPAIHVSTRRLWYTDELESRYQLVRNVRSGPDCLELVDKILGHPDAKRDHIRRRNDYLQTVDDLVKVVVRALEEVECLQERSFSMSGR